MDAREDFGVETTLAAADGCNGDCFARETCVRWSEAPKPNTPEVSL